MEDRLAVKIDRVDERGHPIGTVTRGRVFEARANFRVVHILLFNKHGELLLQQISDASPRNQGLWGSSTAGYLLRGENYSQAAKRKLLDELGISKLSLRNVGRTSMIDNGCRKFIGIYQGVCDGPFMPNPNDFASLWFMSIAEVKRRIANASLHFTETFRHVHDFYLRHRES